MARIISQASYWLKVVTLGAVLGFSIQLAQAWTNPPAGIAPPGGNVAGPINTGAGNQVKIGSFAANDVQGNRLCIGTDCRSAWPAGGAGGGITGSGTTNRIPKWTGTSTIGDSSMADTGFRGGFGTSMVEIVGGLVAYGDNYDNGVIVASSYMTAPVYCALLGCSYFMAPQATSRMKIIDIPSWSGGYISAPALYDSNNGSYSVDPNGQSNMNNIVANNIQSGTFAYTASDASLKKDVKTIPDALGKILKLRGVEFNWKKDNTPSVGLIAEEVEGVFPQLVGTNPTTGVKGVQYEGLIGPLIEAVKEQQQIIDSQNKKIDSLESRLSALEEKLK